MRHFAFRPALTLRGRTFKGPRGWSGKPLHPPLTAPLQRRRCWYSRFESYKCCKKGGDTCFAIAGENRYHVLFGGGPAFAPHPSNSAVPLVAYGASFVLDGPKGGRVVPARRASELCSSFGGAPAQVSAGQF